MPCHVGNYKERKVEDSYITGASFESVPAEQSNALRGFILRNQIETYFVQKRDDEYQNSNGKKVCG